MILKRKVCVTLLFFLIIGIVFYTRLIIKIYKYTDINDAQKADAIVVMGASQWNGQPSPVFQARLNHAFSLYQDGFSLNFILTGGVGDGEKIAESEAGKNYLIEKGVLGQDILKEEKGKTSLQSLQKVAQILEEQKMNSIILVSDGFHMMRLKKMARDLKINAYISPVPDYTSNLTEFRYIMRESLVYLFYLLFSV